MTTLTLTRGLPASGKTTWAKQWLAQDSTRVRVNRDDLRAMMFGTPTYEWAQEELVTAAQRRAVGAALAAGRDVICDDMHLRPRYVREWRTFAAQHGADVVVQEFPISVEESVRRDAQRGAASVGEATIRRLASKFLRSDAFLPVPEEVAAVAVEPVAEVYVPAPGLPTAVLVDIDGTVALKHPDRNIYDWRRVGEDLPNPSVIELVRGARAAGHEVIFCSGRDGVARAATETWLGVHVDSVGEQLLMRSEGDQRRDSIVKRELFDAHVRDRYDVRYVLDDRNQVVEMWRGLGLTCLQVAEGDF